VLRQREDPDLLVPGQRLSTSRWKVSVAPTYLLFLAWWVASGFFVETALALVALACHEVAHLFVLAGYDVPVERIELHPFGAAIRYQTRGSGLGQIDAVVAAAGPLQSFLLASLAMFIEPFEFLDPGRVRFFIQVNLLLACFNLLPVWPLDGGRILRAWLAPRIGDGHAVRLLARGGTWLGLLLLALAAASSLALKQLLWVPALSGAFLWRAARRDARAGQQAIVRTFTRRNQHLPQGTGTATLLATRDDVPASQLLRRLRHDRYNLITVLDSQGLLVGQMSEDEFADGLLKLGLTADARHLLMHAESARRPPAAGQPARTDSH